MSCRITDCIQRLFWSVTVSALLVAFAPRVFADDLKLTDQMITDKIEDELLFDEGVTPYKIDVNTIEGVVTLSGTVNNILSKERAATIGLRRPSVSDRLGRQLFREVASGGPGLAHEGSR